MILSLRLSVRNRAVTLFQLLIMSGNNEKVYYAVGRGREIGIYDSWKECKAQTEGFCNAKYRKFYSLEEANEFITFWKNYSSPGKESVEHRDPLISVQEKSYQSKPLHQWAKELHLKNGNNCAESHNENTLVPGLKLSFHNRKMKRSFRNRKMRRIDTNTKINLQMEVDKHTERLEGNLIPVLNDQSIPIPIVKEEAILEKSPSHTPSNQLQLPSSPHSFDGRQHQGSLELITVNLRLDAFERRFDTCLKEIGAMSSEISHLRSDIRELKESFKSFYNSTSGSTPKKGRDGMFQTTLSFSPGSAYNGPNRSFSSSRRSSSDSDEPNRKRKKTVKRTISKSNISESSKYSKSDEAIDELLSRFDPAEVDLSSFTVDEEGFVIVYTDGSAPNNGKAGAKAGIGVWFGHDHPLNVSQPVVGPPTSITAEIQAARIAVDLATKSGVKKLKIHTDSEFLINCATKWIHRWKKNGWTLQSGGPVKNKKELEKLDKAAAKIEVRWEKVAGHSNILGNETADRLANEGAVKYRR